MSGGSGSRAAVRRQLDKLGGCARCIRAAIRGTVAFWLLAGIASIVVPNSIWVTATVLAAVAFTLLAVAHGVALTERTIRGTVVCTNCPGSSARTDGEGFDRRRLIRTSLAVGGAAVAGAMLPSVEAFGATKKKKKKGYVELSVSSPDGSMATIYATKALLEGNNGKPRFMKLKGVIAHKDLGGSAPMTLSVIAAW